MSFESVHSRSQYPPKGIHPFPDQEFWTLAEWRDEIADVIETAEAEGATDFGGAVSIPAIVDKVPRGRTTVETALEALCQDGFLVRTQGTNPETGRQRTNYTLAENVSGDGDDDYSSPWQYGPVNRTQWGRRHGVIPDVFPFAYLPYSPFKHLKKITEFLQGRPDHTQGVSRAAIRGKLDLPEKASSSKLPHIETACLLNGWWRAKDVTDSRIYFANPDYRHGHSDEWLITDPEKRREHTKRCLRYGISTEYIAPAFDIAPWSVRRYYCSKLEFDDDDIETWQEFYERGKRHRDQTMHALYLWGHSDEEIGAAFGVTKATAWRARNRTEEFKDVVPTDPTFNLPGNDVSPEDSEVVR